MRAALRMTGRERFDAAGAALGIGPERALRGSPTRRAALARIEARIERARAQGTPFPDVGPGNAKERATVRRVLKVRRR